ncbi:hypothetical protein [Vibrio anguillarum]|nr:hypothetical protein [Vibrio anguillarum]AXN03901.1 hypothetical protein DD610_06380 [Vibrio anguillarum]MBF4334086.1 hypothetical protein [Vibrio anguillarum]MBF4423021.1 hypothetical protein [Vibrio anguillarum]MBT2915658.1 hypothetical protein [Vibrio anguillarum]
MSTPTIEEIKLLLPHAHDSLLEDLEKLLELIDCPNDFRGLQKVHTVLEYFFTTHPEHFCSLVELNATRINVLLELFTNIGESYYSQYSNGVHAKGWMSKRPLFSLLFVFYEHLSPESASALLFFLKHYYDNEPVIFEHNHTEQSIRAFRLLYTDPLTDRACFDSNSVVQTADNIRAYRQSLTSENDTDDFVDEPIASSHINYLRELEHFYRLDWKKRTYIERSSKKIIRSSFSRRKIERIVGSDNLFTASLNKRPLKQSLVDSGITANEDYPGLAIIKTEQPILPKPTHELPDVSVIKDTAKIASKSRGISRDVRRSHNITPVSRNILQPHELFHLWQALNSHSNTLIGKVAKSHVQCLLTFILITGRSLDNACCVPTCNKNDNSHIGLTIKRDKLILKVAPRPTADRGKHSNNANLLKTKTVASIHLPIFLFESLSRSGITLGSKLSGKHSVNTFRKAIKLFLKALNKRYHCQISLQRIENYLINRTIALEKNDPVILEILRGEISYYSRSPRHYAWYSETELNNKAQELWSDIFNQIKFYSPEFQSPLFGTLELDLDERGIGSQFTPTKEAIIHWVSEHTRKLHTYTAFEVVKNIKELVNYHNQYTIYTLIMLINASGYRAVYNPMPSFDLLLLRYGALCISDKDSAKTFSHTRVIACPSLLESQLRHYKQHSQTLANLISNLYPMQSQQLYAHTCEHQLLDLSNKVERTEWFLSVKNSQSNDGVFFLFTAVEDDDTIYQTKNSGPSSLSKHINLPLNFGRHYVRRYLQKENIHQELIKFQLGHWVTGETPLERYSSLTHCEAIETLSPILNQMLTDIGWQAIPSLITRKRV